MPHMCSNEKNAASSAADLRQLFFEQLQIRRTASVSKHAGGMQQSTPELLEAHQCAPFLHFCISWWRAKKLEGGSIAVLPLK